MTATDAVVDASAFAKLLRQEPESDVFDAWVAEAGDLHAPTLLPYELANIAVREDLADAYAALVPLLARVRMHPGPGDVWPWAEKLTAYDAAYLALAKRLGAALVTYDGVLGRVAAQHVPVLAPGR